MTQMVLSLGLASGCLTYETELHFGAGPMAAMFALTVLVFAVLLKETA